MQEDIEIKNFLEGFNPKQNVIAVETDFNSNRARVYSQSPDTNDKKMELIPFKPFIYIKDFKRLGVKLYDDNRDRLSAAMRRHEIKVKPMRVTDDNGAVVERLDNGYKYLVQTTSSKGYSAIQSFFKEGGVDIWRKSGRKLSFGLRKPAEIEKTDGLYTLLDQDEKCYFLYNNVRDQYEIHIPAMYVSRFTEKSEDGEGFIRLKGDKTDLLKGIDFDVHYYEPKDKFVIVLKSKEEAEKAKAEAKRKKKEEDDELFPDLEESEEPADITAADVEVFHFSEEDYWNKFEHPKVLKWISDKGDHIDNWKLQLDLVVKYLKEDKNWTKEDVAERKALVSQKNKYDKAKLKELIHREKMAAAKLKAEEEEAERIATATKKYRDIRYTYNKLSITFTETNSTLFFGMKREEQFMVDTGIRLFKGIESYNDVHKATFDIETTDLDPALGRSFLIGVKDNRGTEKVFGVAEKDNDDEERMMYERFFLTLDWINASIIFGYNSENFDWDFVFYRCDKVGVNFENMPESVRLGVNLLRKEGRSIKFGGETETYTQTIVKGKTVLDIYHAVRRTMAINSDILSGTLKNICKHEGIAKPNRTYVPGNKIYSIWRDAKLHAVNKESGEYEEVADETCMLYGDLTMFKTGKEIVEKYLIDDLWETEQVDARYNEDKFLIGKLLPTSFLRTCTMGGASLWNLIMATWSHERGLAIPYALQAQTFTGGLSRTFMLGKFKNVYKFDFSGLYPSLQLEHGIFPKHDVMNGLKRLLLYFKNTRDHFKFLAGDNSPLPENERKPYKAKQLPLKIMNNSNFGANGSAYFNWADFTCAEKITCLGRLYLRNMIQFFMKWDCVPTVCDTDGINMEVPTEVWVDINGNKLDAAVSIDTLVFTAENGKQYVGADALVAKYNSEVLHSEFMKLDNDGMWPSALNVSRKNYANMEPPKEEGKEGKIKFVGNSLKQKTMPAYIKEFMNKGIKLILLDKGKEFVEYYYEYLAQIYTMQIPLMKIANKAKVKQTLEEYANRGMDKNGRQKGRQAHMELIMQMGKKVDLGDIVYYISTGERKSHGYTTIDKKTNQIRAYLITEQEFEQEPDKLGNYNVAKYIDAFNSRISVLLTCFKPEVRETLIKATPTEREYYTSRQMELISLKNPRLEDDIDQFFILADSEVDFWNRTGFDPRKVLDEFTTTKPFDGYEFQDAINKLKPQLENSGYQLKAYYENYTNNDLVLSFNRKPYISMTETGEKVYVSTDVMPYLEDPFKLPFDSKKYNEVKQYRDIMSKGCTLKVEKEFILNKVDQGKLLELKRF